MENRHVLALPQLQGKRSEQSDRLAQEVLTGVAEVGESALPDT